MSVAKPKAESVLVECRHCHQSKRYAEDLAKSKCAICKKSVCPFCIGLGVACPLWDGSYKDVKK